MTKPAAHIAAQNRAAVMAELRRLMPWVGEQRKPLPFGLGTIDSHLPDGGLACGALHEVVPAAESCIAAAFGFLAAVLARISFPPPERGRSTTKGRRVGVSAHTDPSPDCLRQSGPPLSGEGHNLPIILIAPTYGLRPYRPHGRLHGHGLNALGLDPARLILVETANRKETLWAMEEAVRSAAPAAVVGIIDTLDLKLSQRLHLAATDAGLPVFLLRPAPTLESSAAATRWRIGAATAARDRFGLVTQPRWHLQLERCRNGRPGEWVVEYDHVAHRFSLAAALADFSRARGPGETSIRQAS
jgi:protein ImuA